MATDYVKIPATGTGDATPEIATEQDTASDGTTRAVQQVSLWRVGAAILNLLQVIAKPLWYQQGTVNGIRVQMVNSSGTVDTLNTISTVSAVTTVTNVSGLAGLGTSGSGTTDPSRVFMYTNWAQGTRSLIT